MSVAYRNLKAEQARNGYTNEYVANYLGMSRGNYEAKLRNGRFFVSEIRKLCSLYSCDFNYLFAPQGEPEKAS
ncbi:hypothetical protein [Anaerotignum sp.]|uniref:hypothetical protein n=1 Tax=Anaerotignum sp. TaxID=2039241 RepID=UPI0028ACC6CB|nr:hypothetical protein [Anaerotignum sp.]